MADVNSTFSYNANFGPAQAQIRALTKDISSLNAAFLSLDKNANTRRSSLGEGFMRDLGALGGFKTQVVDLTSDVERFGKALQKNQLTLRQYYKEAAQAYKKNSMARRLAEDEVRRAQSQLVGMGSDMQGRKKGMLITPLTIDTSDINTKMAIAQKQFSIFNKLVSDGATQLINWGKNTQWAGRQLTVGLTVPLTIFGATVSKTFREVDKELTRFAKVYGSDLVGANKAATDAMRAQVEQLSKDFAGKYGIAARETAGLAADLAATGLEGQKLLDSVAQTTRLAVLGEVDRQEAMKATLALQSAFNMSTTELAESINFLNAVENQTSASLQDLTEAIPRVGPVINSLGGDVKDLAVLLVAMKEGGVNAAEGANAIKSGLASLINPTKQASETAKQYGIDINGIVSANKGQLMPTLLAFQAQLKNLDDFAKAQIIEQLFGKYQFARISALFDNLNASGSQTVEVMKLMGASSADLAKIANDEVRTLTESSSMRFQRSMEAIKASLLPVGEVLTNSFIPFLEKTANVINMIVEYGRNLPEPVKNFLKLATGFTLIAGPIVMLAGVLGNFLGYLTKGAMMFTRLGAAMAGLRTDKFELLDDNQLAAARSSEILAASYNTQTSSLATLNRALATYIANLRETQRVQPNIFAAGAPSAGRGKAPLKKQVGGEAFVPGSGSGDRVPAMLEPGEYVVNKNAAQKNKDLLNYINFKSAPRFQQGGEFDKIIKTAYKNTRETNVPNIEQWLVDSIEGPTSRGTLSKESRAKFLKEVDAQLKTMSGFSKTSLLNDPVMKEIFAKYGISKRPGRDTSVRTSAPSSILKMRTADQAKTSQEVAKYLTKNQKSLGLTLGQIKQMATMDAAHLVPSVVNGVKQWVPSNLTWVPGAENKGLQYVSGSKNKQFLREALLSAASYNPKSKIDVANVEKILSGGHPADPRGRKLLLEAFKTLENDNRVSAGARTWMKATNALLANNVYGVTDQRILPSTDKRYDKAYSIKPIKVTGGSPTKSEEEAHKTGKTARTPKGKTVQMRYDQTIAHEPFIKLAQEGLGDGSDLKAQRRAVRGQKAGAIGGLAMTGAFMLPALTGTNEALSGFTNALTTAMIALSAVSTIAQVRGIGGAGMGIGAKARALKAGATGGLDRIPAGQTGAGRFVDRATTVANAKQATGSGRVMGGIASKAAGTGKGAMAARGALGALGLVGSASLMIPLAVIAAGVAAFALYQKSIKNAREEGAAMYAEQTKAAEYYGIELKNVNSAMANNAKIAKEMGFAKAPTAATVDPQLKKSILEQEENKKLVEQIKESNDPSSIFLGQYGKMLQQGFSPEQAKEVLSVLAQASGKMGALASMNGTLGGITTEKQATAAIGTSFTQSVGAMYGTGSVGQKDLARVQGQFGELAKAGLTSSDLSDGFKIIEDGIAAAYAEGAKRGLTDNAIGINLGKAVNNQLKDLGFEEGDPVFEAITNLGNTAADTENKMLLVQAAAAGIDLSKFIADGKIAQEEIVQIQNELAATDALAEIDLQINTNIQGAIDAIDTEVQARTAYYDQLIIKNEQAQDSENERTKNFQKNMEKRNKALQKEIKGIQKSADETIEQKEKELEALEKTTKAYVDSLQSKKEEDSFLAQQSQTALGGLGALAGGDVIGFLAAQEEMASNANAYAQQGEIDRIQEIADAEAERLEAVIDTVRERTEAEVQALQDQIDKNQELMDGEGERHEKRMENLQKEALKIQTDKAAELGRLNDTKAKLQELMDLPVGEKLGKDLGKYAAGISEVAANMPKSAQDTMNKLAKSFGDNFQSVFDAELQKSADAYGVNPTNLKTLIQKSLPSAKSSSDRKNREGGYAAGGYITGPGSSTSDSIPAMLSNGEYVIKADSVKRIGKGTLDKINNGYRTGGGEAISSATAFAGGVKTAVAAITAGNALASAAANAMNEEPENNDGMGSGSPSSIPEKLGKVARILRGNYRVSARGTYPSGNKHSARYGTAIDYATPTGTGVYAMASGQASNLNKGNSSFGKYVTIKHGDGTESLYAHLDSHGKGGTVNAGDFIGETGNTGNSTGPHLHFEWSALKNGNNPPGMRIGGETMSDGLAKLHKGEMVLTKPLTQTLKDGISDMRVGVPAMASTSGVASSGTIVSDNRVINVNVNASGSGMNPDMVAQRIVSAINKQESRRSFGRSS
jgi:TP901 family phage tail tape measure protein